MYSPDAYDLAAGEWTKIKVVVSGERAQLYVQRSGAADTHRERPEAASRNARNRAPDRERHDRSFRRT